LGRDTAFLTSRSSFPLSWGSRFRFETSFLLTKRRTPQEIRESLLPLPFFFFERFRSGPFPTLLKLTAKSHVLTSAASSLSSPSSVSRKQLTRDPTPRIPRPAQSADSSYPTAFTFSWGDLGSRVSFSARDIDFSSPVLRSCAPLPFSTKKRTHNPVPTLITKLFPTSFFHYLPRSTKSSMTSLAQYRHSPVDPPQSPRKSNGVTTLLPPAPESASFPPLFSNQIPFPFEGGFNFL